jgi:putative transposase
LVVRLAPENADCGYGKIVGELFKLGHDLSKEAVANFLDRHGILPAPERGGALGWRQLMTP